MTRAELPERIETERLLLRVRTVADAEGIFDFASLPEVSYPAGFPPVKTLEDEIYYLEHILPDRNEKDNLPTGYGIVVKGTDKVIGSVDFNHRHEDDVLEIGYAAGGSCQSQLVSDRFRRRGFASAGSRCLYGQPDAASPEGGAGAAKRSVNRQSIRGTYYW